MNKLFEILAFIAIIGFLGGCVSTETVVLADGTEMTVTRTYPVRDQIIITNNSSYELEMELNGSVMAVKRPDGKYHVVRLGPGESYTHNLESFVSGKLPDYYYLKALAYRGGEYVGTGLSKLRMPYYNRYRSTGYSRYSSRGNERFVREWVVTDRDIQPLGGRGGRSYRPSGY